MDFNATGVNERFIRLKIDNQCRPADVLAIFLSKNGGYYSTDGVFFE